MTTHCGEGNLEAMRTETQNAENLRPLRLRYASLKVTRRERYLSALVAVAFAAPALPFSSTKIKSNGESPVSSGKWVMAGV